MALRLFFSRVRKHRDNLIYAQAMTHLRQAAHLAELLKLLRAAASNSSAATAQKKAQTHAEAAAAPSDRQLLSSPRLIVGAAPSSPDSPEQRVAARIANAEQAAAAPPFSVEFQI